MQYDRLDAVRQILKSKQFQASSLADKQITFDTIKQTGEISPKELTQLIDETTKEKLRADWQHEKLVKLNDFESMPYSAFLSMIEKGEINGRELIGEYANSKKLQEYADRPLIDQRTKDVYPYYGYYRLLSKEFKKELPPGQNAKKIYLDLIGEGQGSLSSKPSSFSGRETTIKSSKKFYLTDNRESPIKRLSNEKECYDYNLNELEQFLWDIKIELAIEILITDDNNICLIKLEQVYDNNTKNNNIDFKYRPVMKKTPNGEEADAVCLFNFNPNAKVIYNKIIIYDHLYPEILPWLFHQELAVLLKGYDLKDPNQRREFFPINKNNRRYNIIPELNYLNDNDYYDNLTKLFNTINITKLIDSSLQILRDYALNTNIEEDNIKVERFDTSWALFKDSICDLLYLLFKLGKIAKTNK